MGSNSFYSFYPESTYKDLNAAGRLEPVSAEVRGGHRVRSSKFHQRTEGQGQGCGGGSEAKDSAQFKVQRQDVNPIGRRSQNQEPGMFITLLPVLPDWNI